jgi:hypothetical protein
MDDEPDERRGLQQGHREHDGQSSPAAKPQDVLREAIDHRRSA